MTRIVLAGLAAAALVTGLALADGTPISQAAPGSVVDSSGSGNSRPSYSRSRSTVTTTDESQTSQGALQQQHAVPVLPDPPKPAPITPGYHPTEDSAEGGIWMVFDKYEQTVRTSPLLVQDPGLNKYIRGIICRLAKDVCPDTRIYIIETSSVNAAMAPNGFMEVWTGLLLRTQNEAQLSCVLGHEIAHYTLRHALARWQKLLQITDSNTAIAALTTPAGAAGARSELLRFSREEENEADVRGQELVAKAGYDPTQCAAIWQEQIDEHNAEPTQTEYNPYMHDHPAAEERLITLRGHAAEMPEPRKPYTTGGDSLHNAINGFRSDWLSAELNRSHYGQSLVVLQRLIVSDPKSGDLHYWTAEAYRRRNDGGDASLASDEYKLAIASGTAPVSAYRGLGLTEMKTGDSAGAQQAFQHYLDAAPAADDRAMVQYYIAHLGAHS
jgi:predicted Zn-dependent protease